jgi:predicted outer membrane repeat protein
MNRSTIATNAAISVIRSAGWRCWLASFCGLLAVALALSAALMPKRGLAAPLATIWQVAPGGNDANDCLTSVTACAHIEAAINKAASGDTIQIAAGIYAENLSVYGYDNLTLQGADQVTTIIDGQGLIGSVLTINNATINLSGLTVRNGKYPYGAGLYIYPASAANLINSRVIDNVGQTGGGGILNQGRLKLTNVSLSNNTNLGSSDRGGGLLNLGSAELINCTVANNQALSNFGGGIGNRGVLTITGGTLSGNQAGSGGAIYNENSLILNATLISHNQAKGAAGGGIYNAGLGFNPGSVIDAGSLITENVAATSGGGVHNASTGNLVLAGTRIVSNTANTFGGGLYSDGAASLSGVSVNDNRAVSGSGGGLYFASTNGTLTINQG